ncbi:MULTISPECIES: PilW family protein [Pseudomonadaceae]|jgi:type IV pilus assembly protein PilW|uniref:PilW family protein n=1 Tax=Pseudomonadaceae TaxID=135621 RepID=UPI0009E24D96|nr:MULTISPECIES: PilW family protein [Pseudomonas]MBO2929637.1 PilW family protein [Pseudomonas otitidis]
MRHKIDFQAGLSLVELLIALVVSAFLILGVTQIYIDNKSSYLAQQAVGELQGNSRFALRFLEQLIMKAGYKSLPQDSREMAFPALVAQGGCPSFAAGQVVGVTSSGKGVCLRYQRRSVGELDCLGAPISVSAAITTKIELSSNGELLCSAQGSASQAMFSGVSDLQIVLGVDLNSDRIVDAYIANPTVGSVVSVRMAFLQRSDNTNVALGKQDYNFPLSSAASTTAVDKRVYRSTQSTFTVRNYAQ